MNSTPTPNHTADSSVPESAANSVPLTWLILGDKQGDNGQLYTVADRLGWPCVQKKVQMREQYVLGKPRFSATLDHLDLARCDPLEAPWPDLILTIGRRPSMVALWIRRQSGNRTKIVLLGKPTGRMREFALVVTSALNQVVPLDNLLPITLPLMRIDPDAISRDLGQWQTRLEGLSRPLIAVLIGGPTSPFKMNRAVAEALVRAVEHIQRELHGTAYIVTSRRTRPRFVAELRQMLPAETPFFSWSANAPDNPYKALLGGADGFIVTGDSISMMVEVIYAKKPLAILPLPQGLLGSLDNWRRSLARILFNPRRNSGLDRLRHRVARLVYRIDYFRLLSSTRDFHHFHRLLVAKGFAVWCGEPFNMPSRAPEEDVERVVSAIRELFPDN